MQGKRVRYRGRVGVVVQHRSLTESWGKSVTIRFGNPDYEDAEEIQVPHHLWPLIKVLD